MDIIIVITKNRTEFLEFLSNIDKDDKNLYIYAEPHKLERTRANKIIYYGNYTARPDFFEINKLAESRILPPKPKYNFKHKIAGQVPINLKEK